MGSAAVSHLARRGLRVLGLDQFDLGHTLGSSHGESRIIRLAYFEHPNYVPLLHRAYVLWEALAQDTGHDLLRLTGGVFAGSASSPLVVGSALSARTHDLPHEILVTRELRRRFPAFTPAADDVALFESRAGVLFPERCIEAHLSLAQAAGAELRHGVPVRSWQATSAGVEVETPEGRLQAGQLVVTAGAWLGKLFADLRLPLQPERIPIFWMQPRQSPALLEADRFPIYIWDVPDLGVFYGFPHLDWAGAKVGRHHNGEDCDPDTVSREPTAADEAPVRAFLEQRIPILNGPLEMSRVCLYTNTPDEHFLVDRHPAHPNVLFAGGFSGHGFKFASVIGEILADLATTGSTAPAADFLRLGRFADGRQQLRG
jgi:sarcosine oxidase